MDLLDYVQKVDLLESTKVVDMAHKLAYFIPDSMTVWNLLRQFHIRKVHMAVVLNEYGGTLGMKQVVNQTKKLLVKSLTKMNQKRRSRRKLATLWCEQREYMMWMLIHLLISSLKT